MPLIVPPNGVGLTPVIDAILGICDPWDALEVTANFVVSLDGVITADATTPMGTRVVSHNRPQDGFVMAVLRARSRCLLLGAETFGQYGASAIEPGAPSSSNRDAIASVREQHVGAPLHVAVVTGRGSLVPDHPIFAASPTPVIVITTKEGADRMAHHPNVDICVIPRDQIARRAIPEIRARIGEGPILCEGGAGLFSSLLRVQALTSLNLTLSPTLIGSGPYVRHLIEGNLSTAKNTVRTQLTSLRQNGDLLFAHYRFDHS